MKNIIATGLALISLILAVPVFANDGNVQSNVQTSITIGDRNRTHQSSQQEIRDRQNGTNSNLQRNDQYSDTYGSQNRINQRNRQSLNDLSI